MPREEEEAEELASQEEYVAQLTDHQQQALRIARDQLCSSFSLEKSIGYTRWKAANK